MLKLPIALGRNMSHTFLRFGKVWIKDHDKNSFTAFTADTDVLPDEQ